MRPSQIVGTGFPIACLLLSFSLFACSPGIIVDGALADGGTSDDAAPLILIEGVARVVDTDGQGLRLRNGASTDAAQLATIPEGCLVKLLGGVDGDWYEVGYRDLTGYTNKDYLLEIEETDAEDCSISDDAMLLPWDAGDSYKVTNGHHTNTHVDFDDWAWDFGMPVGTPLLAVHDGTIRRVKGNSTRGGCSKSYISDANYVVIDRGDGTEALYFHLTSVSVSAGQEVQRGQLIGYSGQTGWACGAHLHFQVQKGPTGGGTSSGWNPSLHSFFYDTGAALDPASGSKPVSANGRP